MVWAQAWRQEFPTLVYGDCCEAIWQPGVDNFRFTPFLPSPLFVRCLVIILFFLGLRSISRFLFFRVRATGFDRASSLASSIGPFSFLGESAFLGSPLVWIEQGQLSASEPVVQAEAEQCAHRICELLGMKRSLDAPADIIER